MENIKEARGKVKIKNRWSTKIIFLVAYLDEIAFGQSADAQSGDAFKVLADVVRLEGQEPELGRLLCTESKCWRLS